MGKQYLLWISLSVVTFFCFIGHTNGDWTSGTFSQTEQNQLVDTTNNKRRAITPEATTMKKLKWNATFAAWAKEWTDGCKGVQLAHKEGIGFSHEIAGLLPFEANEYVPVSAIVEYVYNQYAMKCTNVCQAAQEGIMAKELTCDEAKTLLWDTASAIGCAMTNCTIDGQEKHLVGCVVGPGVDKSDGSCPYEIGTKCTKCGTLPDTECVLGLCQRNCEKDWHQPCDIVSSGEHIVHNNFLKFLSAFFLISYYW